MHTLQVPWSLCPKSLIIDTSISSVVANKPLERLMYSKRIHSSGKSHLAALLFGGGLGLDQV